MRLQQLKEARYVTRTEDKKESPYYDDAKDWHTMGEEAGMSASDDVLDPENELEAEALLKDDLEAMADQKFGSVQQANALLSAFKDGWKAGFAKWDGEE